MKFKIGDYVKHKEYPKSKVVLHIRGDIEKQVINTHAEDFELATEDEIKRYNEVV